MDMLRAQVLRPINRTEVKSRKQLELLEVLAPLQTRKIETVAEILDSIWTGQVITFIQPVPTIFSQGSQRCLDRVTTCQTPPRALSTSRTSPYPNWDCIAETISTPPVHDVAISPLATPRTSAPCATWAIEAPVARLTSW